MTSIPVGTPGVPGLPYGATTGSVRQLVLDTAAEGRQITSKATRVSDEVLAGWITQAAGIVASRVYRLALLPSESLTGSLDQARVTSECRHLVELYAAALLSDVTHPERTGPERLGQVLLDRFWKLLDGLAASVDAALADPPGEDDTVGTDDDPGLGAGCFPDRPLFTRRMGF